MITSLKVNNRIVFSVLLLALLILWWFVSPIISTQYFSDQRFLGDFPSIYVLMALYGAICAITVANVWGGFSSMMGKSVMYFSLGLFAQVFGQIVYAYYSFYEHQSAPYPSFGDLGYFGSIPLYILGVYYLAQVSGIKFKVKTTSSIIKIIALPIIVLGFAYILFLQDYTFNLEYPLKTLLDFGYPLGQAIYVSMAVLTYHLSKGVLGGIMKNKILFIILALLVQFLADYTFLYQLNAGTWSAGGLNDVIYLTAYFLMFVSIEQLGMVKEEINPSSKI